MPGVNTIQESYNVNTKTLFKPKTMDINNSCTPHLHRSMTASTPSFTLNPGTITRYPNNFESHILEVIMRKPPGNLKTRPDHQHILMKPHPKHEDCHPLGDTCQEVSMSGTCDQEDMSKNHPEMKRMFQNKVATRRLMMVIWSQELTDIRGTLRDDVL
jgi:hypothetical protein